MANSSAVYVRMDPTLKEAAEDILAQLGITSSGAVQCSINKSFCTVAFLFP